jgi:hypothetical protein
MRIIIPRDVTAGRDDLAQLAQSWRKQPSGDQVNPGGIHKLINLHFAGAQLSTGIALQAMIDFAGIVLAGFQPSFAHTPDQGYFPPWSFCLHQKLTVNRTSVRAQPTADTAQILFVFKQFRTDGERYRDSFHDPPGVLTQSSQVAP